MGGTVPQEAGASPSGTQTWLDTRQLHTVGTVQREMRRVVRSCRFTRRCNGLGSPTGCQGDRWVPHLHIKMGGDSSTVTVSQGNEMSGAVLQVHREMKWVGLLLQVHGEMRWVGILLQVNREMKWVGIPSEVLDSYCMQGSCN